MWFTAFRAMVRVNTRARRSFGGLNKLRSENKEVGAGKDTDLPQPPPTSLACYGSVHGNLFNFDLREGHLAGSALSAEINPFSTAVPCWGQTAQFSSTLSPNRDCGANRVNHPRLGAGGLIPSNTYID